MEHNQPVAVVGVSTLFPEAEGNRSFWQNILEGRDSVTEVPPSHWLIEDYYHPDPAAIDKIYCKRGAFLAEIDFNPVEFAVPPNNLRATDTCQLLALVVAKKVLAEVGRSQFKNLDREKTSIILGVASTTELVTHLGSRIQRPFWAKALREEGLPEEAVQQICDRIADSYVPWQENSFPGLLGNVVAGRIANYFDLKGTNTALDAACASSLSAVSMAVMELQTGRSDLVITGGVDAMNDVFMYMCFSKTMALSPTGDCRPFSEQADGTVLGEGIGMLALKRLADAERDGDTIYAVIKGLGSSSDGKSKSIFAPSPPGQAIALRRAYEQAGYAPDTVELLEAHGTGTKAGDAAEFEGLSSVFRSEKKKQWCALGSIKSQIGHTKAAAGTAGLFKAIMALHHKVLPGTIKVEKPNPNLKIEDSPFYINTQSRPWIRGPEHPRRASVSAFGFGGSNFHVTLEEYRQKEQAPPKLRTMPWELFLFAADSPKALLEEGASLLKQLALRALSSEEERDLHMLLAKESQAQYDSQKGYRLVVIASDLHDLQLKIEASMEHLQMNPDQGLERPDGIYYGSKKITGKIAFLFPGQGSQYVNMGRDLALHFDCARAVWDRSAELAVGESGAKLHHFVFPKPAFDDPVRQMQRRHLTDTRIAQPAIGAMSLSLLYLLKELGLKADFVAGHSYGEITALAAAGVFSEGEMLSIAQKRGELMYEASLLNEGAMTAVFLHPDQVRERIDQLNLSVVIANVNSPEQVVVAGLAEEIGRLEDAFKEDGIYFSRLPVSTAFHSPMVAACVTPFREYLQNIAFAQSAVPVYANLSAEPYPQEPKAMRELLLQQIVHPVRFADSIGHLEKEGVELFIEVGPGTVLTGLTRQCLKGQAVKTIATDHQEQHGILSLLQALALISVSGIKLDYAYLWAGYAPVPDPRRQEKAAYRVKIGGANYGKPDPAERMIPARERAAAENGSVEGKGVKRSRQKAVNKSIDRQVRVMQPKEQPRSHKNIREPEGPSSSLAFIQKQMTEAHLAFQKALTESHQAYLHTSRELLAALTEEGQASADRGWRRDEAPLLQEAEGSFAQETRPGVEEVALGAQPPKLPLYSLDSLEEPNPGFLPPPVSLVPLQGAKEEAVRLGDRSQISMPIAELMLEVVSEKTGYPVEMLDLDIDLESGLGIDSIKRVEILSTVQEKLGSRSTLNTAAMGGLHTLKEIIGFLEENVKKK